MFNSLFRKTRGEGKEEKATQSLLPEGVRRTVASFIPSHSIPPMPSNARAAFELSINPEAETKDFVALVESDEALASRLLKISNSVFYDRGGVRSKTVEESVMTIGIDEIRGLLQATTLQSVFPDDSPMRKFLWSHDVATGIIARFLANEMGVGFRDQVFLAGLMHDIGKLVLNHRYPNEFSRIVEDTRRRDISFMEAELDQFPFSHTEIGVMVGEQWRFSPQLLQAIRDHHLPWEELQGDSPITRIIKAADTVSHALGIGHPSGFTPIRQRAERDLSRVWEECAIVPERGPQLLDAAAEAVERESTLLLGSVR